ncbi:hypothetical protein [Pseudomonas sp. GOM6]|uniref:hypothetical protein n=1 Tax=Pseudomonas sp. GOM6 TaxID=3036944 RepID=UPI0024096586|nr:hypothetical protein [Pseudomonas sp. GOM6]MDG1581006.1 hypothetical protein [Pseudomonas sp. GOM6]
MISTAQLGSMVVENLWIGAALVLLLLIPYVLALAYENTPEAAEKRAEKWRALAIAEEANGNSEVAARCFAKAAEWEAVALLRSAKL